MYLCHHNCVMCILLPVWNFISSWAFCESSKLLKYKKRLCRSFCVLPLSNCRSIWRLFGFCFHCVLLFKKCVLLFLWLDFTPKRPSTNRVQSLTLTAAERVAWRQCSRISRWHLGLWQGTLNVTPVTDFQHQKSGLEKQRTTFTSASCVSGQSWTIRQGIQYTYKCEWWAQLHVCHCLCLLLLCYCCTVVGVILKQMVYAVIAEFEGLVCLWMYIIFIFQNGFNLVFGHKQAINCIALSLNHQNFR